LFLPGHLLGELGVAFGQLLEALIGFDAGDDGVQFLRADPLAVVFAVLAPLQQKVRALSDGLAGPLDLEGLLADMAADHAVHLGHLFEDAGAFLLEGGRDHSWAWGTRHCHCI
jgi:hypothetical protein